MNDDWLPNISQEGASVSAGSVSNSVGGTASFVEPGWALKSVVKAFAFAASTEARNNLRADRFFTLHETILRMTKTPHEHRFHISTELSSAALDMLGILKETFDIDAPRIFPSEDETLVLVWEEEDAERMLSIGVGEMDLTERSSTSPVPTTISAEFKDDGELRLLFEHLKKPVLSGSAAPVL